jgi:hypothetical protein
LVFTILMMQLSFLMIYNYVLLSSLWILMPMVFSIFGFATRYSFLKIHSMAQIGMLYHRPTESLLIALLEMSILVIEYDL